MRSIFAWATAGVVFMGGCTFEDVTPDADQQASESGERSAHSPSAARQTPLAAAPDASASGAAAEVEPPPAPLVDDFGLPLVIVLDPPEVPEQIRDPSPPIKEEAKE